MTTTFDHSQHLIIMKRILDQMLWFWIKCCDFGSNVVIWGSNVVFWIKCCDLQHLIIITTFDHHNIWSSQHLIITTFDHHVTFMFETNIWSRSRKEWKLFSLPKNRIFNYCSLAFSRVYEEWLVMRNLTFEPWRK